MSLPLVAIGLCLQCLTTQAGRDERVGLIRALIQEGQPEWERWRESETRLSGRAHYEGWAQQDGARLTQNEKDLWISFKRNGSLYVGILQGSGRDGASAMADGPYYGFWLTRATENSPWIIRNLTSGPPSPPEAYLNQAHNLAAYLEVPTRLEGIPIEDLLRDPRLECRKVSREDRDGLPTVRIEFEVPPEVTGARFHEAWVEFSPAMNWAITRTEYSRWPYSRTFVTNEYKPGKDGRMKLYQCFEREIYPEQNVEEHRRYTFEDLEARLVPNAEFTLSAFGLPEPGNRPAPPGVPVHFWLYAAAAALFVAALLLKRKAGRT